MKILSAEVNWYENFGNSPDLMVVVDKIPALKGAIYQGHDFNEKCRLYYTFIDGYVDYFVHQRNYEEGYGGRTFSFFYQPKPDATPTYISIRGPWSSRAGVVNSVLERHCVDVTIRPENGGGWRTGAITLDLARVAAKLAGVRLEESKYKGEPLYTPRKIIPPNPLYMPAVDRLLMRVYESTDDEGQMREIANYFEKYYGRDGFTQLYNRQREASEYLGKFKSRREG